MINANNTTEAVDKGYIIKIKIFLFLLIVIVAAPLSLLRDQVSVISVHQSYSITASSENNPSSHAHEDGTRGVGLPSK